MNWQDIQVSADSTHFIYEKKRVFDKQFIEVLKFHSPGIAPVKDNSGCYHIDTTGKQLYSNRYERTFGYYCKRAAVLIQNSWFHIDEKGSHVYEQVYSWVGNYQENLCTVRSKNETYFHIDLNGNRTYEEVYRYAGDYKDGYACVKLPNGLYCHIDILGNTLCNKVFNDLGVFHKNFATAKDESGWFHIDKKGIELYSQRYNATEPFYNGHALVTQFDNQKLIIDELGNEVLKV